MVAFLSGLFVFVWATGFIVARFAADHADPLTFIAIRCALSVAVFAALTAFARVPWPRDPREWRNAMVAGMLLHGVYIGGVFWAVRNGMPAGLTGIVTGLNPLLTAALAIPLLRERVTAPQWAGIAVGFVGIGLVLSPGLGDASSVPVAPLVVVLAATLALTLGTIWQKRSQPRMDLRANALMQFIGAFVLVAPAAYALEPMRFDGSAAAWGAMAWAVLVISVGGISILLFLLRKGAASRVAPLLYLAPPLAAVIAAVLFGERLAPIQVAGTVLAVVGAFAARRAPR